MGAAALKNSGVRKTRTFENHAPLGTTHLGTTHLFEKKMRGDLVRGVLMRGVFRCGKKKCGVSGVVSGVVSHVTHPDGAR